MNVKDEVFLNYVSLFLRYMNNGCMRSYKETWKGLKVKRSALEASLAIIIRKIETQNYKIILGTQHSKTKIRIYNYRALLFSIRLHGAMLNQNKTHKKARRNRMNIKLFQYFSCHKKIHTHIIIISIVPIIVKQIYTGTKHFPPLLHPNNNKTMFNRKDENKCYKKNSLNAWMNNCLPLT